MMRFDYMAGGESQCLDIIEKSSLPAEKGRYRKSTYKFSPSDRPLYSPAK
jgi:hypothetical protein